MAFTPVDNDPFATPTPTGRTPPTLTPVDNDPFAAREESRASAQGILGSAARGMAPYATGAAVGAALGAPFGGVGAIPGAAAGAGAVAAADLSAAVYNPIARAVGLPEMSSVQDLTDDALDAMGVKRPSTPIERITETAAGGLGGGASAARAAGGVGRYLSGTSKGVAEKLAANPGMQTLAGGSSGAAAQSAQELGAGPTAQACG